MDAPLEEEDEEFDDTGDINNAVLLLLPTELLLAEVGVVTLLMLPLGTMVEFWSSDLFGLLGDGGTCVVCVGVGGIWGGIGCSGGCCTCAARKGNVFTGTQYHREGEIRNNVEDVPLVGMVFEN